MKTLEWNPAFGPIVSAMIILGAGFSLSALSAFRAASRRVNSWLCFCPRCSWSGLLVVALLDPDLKLYRLERDAGQGPHSAGYFLVDGLARRRLVDPQRTGRRDYP